MKRSAIATVVFSGSLWLTGALCPAAELDSRSIRFMVADTESTLLEGVEVLLVKADGVEKLGETDALGSLKVQKSQLEQEGGLAVLFCKEWYFCGAFLMSQPRFLEFEERFIVLAPFTMM